MDLVNVKGNSQLVSGTNPGVRFHTRCHCAAPQFEIEKDLRSEQFVHVAGHLEVESLIPECKALFFFENVLRADSEDDAPAVPLSVDEGFRLFFREGNTLSFKFKKCPGARNAHCRIEEIHLRRAHESRHKQVAGFFIQILRRVDLLHYAVFHDDDPGSQCHRLRLVMCDINDRGAQSLVEFGNFRPHLDTEFGVQVGEGLVHKEYLGLADDRPAHGNTLLLAA